VLLQVVSIAPLCGRTLRLFSIAAYFRRACHFGAVKHLAKMKAHNTDHSSHDLKHRAEATVGHCTTGAFVAARM
jgi:hypothetical protein